MRKNRIALLLAVSLIFAQIPTSAYAAETLHKSVTENPETEIVDYSDAIPGDDETAGGTFTSLSSGIVSTDKEQETRLDPLGNGMDITAMDSVGEMLAREIRAKSGEQIDNNGCNVFSIEFSDRTAIVDMETIEDAKVIVGLYDEKTGRLETSGIAVVEAGTKSAEVPVEGDMPEYFITRVFLVGSEDLAPLCSVYETFEYTKDMQDFLNKTTEDFDSDLVYNYDEDITNNFLIYNDEVLRIKEGSGNNRLVSANEVSLKYEFEGVDVGITGLSKGDIVSYEYRDGRILIIKVSSVELSGTNATVNGIKAYAEEAFDFIRIDETSTNDRMDVDDSNIEDGISYDGLKNDEEFNANYASSLFEKKEGPSPESADKGIDIGGGASHEFVFNPDKEWKLGDGTYKESVKIDGKVGLKIDAEFKLIKTLFHTSVELKMDYSLGVSLKIIGKVQKEFPLAKMRFFLPCVEIGLEPKFVLESSASVEFRAEVSGSVGFKVGDDGGVDLTKTPEGTARFKGEVKISVGLKLTPYAALFIKELADIEFSAKVCIESVGKITTTDISKGESRSTTHLCKECIDGDLYFDTELKGEVKILGDIKWKPKISLLKLKFGDWYYSYDKDEFGFDECPYRLYQTLITVIDATTKKPIKNAEVLVTSDSECKKLLTKSNGLVSGYYTNGGYSVKIEAPGYVSKTISFLVDGKAQNITVDIDIRANSSTRLSLGSGYSSVIDDTGNLWMWGDNTYGQLGNGTTTSSYIPLKVMGNIRTVSLGFSNSAAIDSAGNLWSWGSSSNGMLGNGTDGIFDHGSSIPVKIMENIKTVSIGQSHSAAIDNSGNLWMWGSNVYGQLGNGTNGYGTGSGVPVKIMENIRTVSIGESHSAAIDNNGNLWTWGSNKDGQLGNGTQTDSSVPIKIMENVRDVSLGIEHSAAIN